MLPSSPHAARDSQRLGRRPSTTGPRPAIDDRTGAAPPSPSPSRPASTSTSRPVSTSTSRPVSTTTLASPRSPRPEYGRRPSTSQPHASRPPVPAPPAPDRDRTGKRKKHVGAERYLVGHGGYDAAEYRAKRAAEANRTHGTVSAIAATTAAVVLPAVPGATATMGSGSKSTGRTGKSSTAAQSFIFGQPRDKYAGTANPAAEAASKSATVNPAPRLRAGSASTSIASAQKKPASEPTAPVFKHEGRRRWLRDPQQVYPLPVDLEEIHRQSMRLVLMMRLFAAPFCNTSFLASARGGEPKVPPDPPAKGKAAGGTAHAALHGHPPPPAAGPPPPPRDGPAKVLEVACGAATWSGACHDYLARQNITDVQFTGMDVAPLAADLSKKGKMNWRFVQWDLRHLPWPFADGEFDFVFLKDVSLCGRVLRTTPTPIPETLRVLRRGGVVEFWDSDYVFRTLLSNPQLPPGTRPAEAAQAAACAVYPFNASTPFVPAQNRFLTECNAWITDALMKRELSPSPCGLVEWTLRTESDRLRDIDSRRLAIPLDHTRWEREAGRQLTPDQHALRRTALLTSLQFIAALEPLLRPASEKRPDEWSRFWAAMMRDLLENDGASNGECLEVGAWWAVRY